MRLDEFLPDYQFSEYHEIRVNASPEIVFKALKRADMSASLVVRGLLTLRMLPHLLKQSRAPIRGHSLRFDDFTKLGFILLEDVFPEEMVLGLAGQFWKPAAQLLRMPPEKFRGFARPGYGKAVWNIRVRSVGPGRSELSTTTRIQCLGTRGRVLFTCYWTVIRPFSGLIRKILLQLIRREAESCIALPGGGGRHPEKQGPPGA